MVAEEKIDDRFLPFSIFYAKPVAGIAAVCVQYFPLKNISELLILPVN